MTWEAAAPMLMAKAGRQVKVQAVAVPAIPREIPEELLATLDRLGAEDPSVRECLMVLSTEKGVIQLRQVAAMAGSGVLTVGASISVLDDLARDRQIAVLRWQD